MEIPTLSQDPRREQNSPHRNWEEGVQTQESAEGMFYLLTTALTENKIEINSSTKILEIGSGLGVFIDYLRKNGYDATGVDARPRGKISEGIVAARIEQLPFSNETFNIVVANGVFDSGVYNQDQVLMIKEISRVLATGGVYIAPEKLKEATQYRTYLEEISSNRLASIYRKK